MIWPTSFSNFDCYFTIRLETKFVNEQRDLKKKELESKHQYEQLVQYTNDEIEGLDEAMQRKQAYRAAALKASAEAQKELESSTNVQSLSTLDMGYSQQ